MQKGKGCAYDSRRMRCGDPKWTPSKHLKAFGARLHAIWRSELDQHHFKMDPDRPSSQH